MKISDFNRLAKLHELSEIEKVAKLSYYMAEVEEKQDFDVSEVTALLVSLGYAKPNQTRLVKGIQKSPLFIRGSKSNRFRLTVVARASTSQTLPRLKESEEIISDDTLLPEAIFSETRRLYLLRLAQQINSSYENNLFDACALIMRRMLEILLIHTFENCGIEAQALDTNGNYRRLKELIERAKSIAEVGLSADAKKAIDQFRELGNLSAHRIKYNCRRDDIRIQRLEYRALIEELLYKSGLRAIG